HGRRAVPDGRHRSAVLSPVFIRFGRHGSPPTPRPAVPARENPYVAACRHARATPDRTATSPCRPPRPSCRGRGAAATWNPHRTVRTAPSATTHVASADVDTGRTAGR